MRPTLVPALLFLALGAPAALTGCGRDDAAPRPAPGGSTASSPTSSTAGSASAPASAYALAADPGEAVPVLEAKLDGPKESVVVVGRVREMLERRAGFTLIDASVPYCGETEMEGCPTPWDYCCIPPERVREATITVRVRGADGRTVKVDRLPELRSLDLVAVRGTLVKDGDDLALDATGWYRRARPDIEQGVDWPE